MATEFERIAWLRATIERARGGSLRRGDIGPGDDAAAWKPPAGSSIVMTNDAQLEGVHFRREWLSWRDVGRRAMAAAASDIAAMAARPAGALLALSLPADFSERDFRALFRGMLAEAGEYGLAIFGGNLTRGPTSITTTVIGHAKPSELVKRSGARPGDAIFVTGHPGRSRVGLELASRDAGARATRGLAAKCLAAFRTPRARISAALALARATPIHAMVDVSDGLAADVGHIVEESGGGAVLRRSAVLGVHATGRGKRGGDGPFDALCRSVDLDPLTATLHGGEDFELAFTAPAASERRIAACAKRIGLAVTRVGEMVREGKGVVVVDDEGAPVETGDGFDHFR